MQGKHEGRNRHEGEACMKGSMHEGEACSGVQRLQQDWRTTHLKSVCGMLYVQISNCLRCEQTETPRF